MGRSAVSDQGIKSWKLAHRIRRASPVRMLCRGTSPGENSSSWGVGSVEVRGVGDDGDERGTGSATEFGPACDAGNAFQTGAVGDSEPENDDGCSAAGHVFVSVDGTWGVAILVSGSATTSDRDRYLDGDCIFFQSDFGTCYRFAIQIYW